MSPVGITDGILFGMGNPLLDISAHGDQEFLDKYGLKANNAILAEDQHMPLYDEMVSRFKVSYVAGGATQNALRTAQWLLSRPNASTFFGCVGRDATSEKLSDAARADGVNVVYQYNDSTPTGRCAVVVTQGGQCRSLCAHLAAANCFTAAHLEDTAHWALVEKAHYFYVSGFFLTVSIESILKVAQFAAKHNRVFMMNLSAPFLSQFFKDQQMKAFPYVDILFGNETEAATFSAEQNLGTTDIKEIALKAAALPKENTKRSRMVVFTQGELEVVVALDGKVQTFPVGKVDDVLDTNGAGDAFVGGFLAQYIQGRPLEVCVRCGVYAAQAVIQCEGCTFPERPEFVE
ncbi:adenosine kinase-like [Pollicipes pollicipes]|uniref:adenosine kinase-like n=1 Tax=Pollicipes pollicipes TaxID=41117 RepID=UPI0018852613|nr:adenosine kinase-like [Pollicipes pollicipes]XP_037084120.1 adenosine kinase-like [Pollicipes pollicipes]